MASRSQSYKKSTMDKREKRLLRVHRRSLDQREMRLDEVNKRRQIDDMSPVLESQGGSKNPSCSVTPGCAVNQQAAATAASRQQRLKKWKEERELKRKLEALERGKSKPGFRVTHVTHKDADIYRKSATSHPQKSDKETAPKPSAGTSRPTKYRPPAPVVQSKAPRTGSPKTVKPVHRPAPVTRATKGPSTTKAAAATKASAPAKAATGAPKAAKAKQPSPAKRAARGAHFMAPTAASRTRAAVNTKKVPSQPEKKKSAAPQTLVKVKSASKTNVTIERGHISSEAEAPSFAPNDGHVSSEAEAPSFAPNDGHVSSEAEAPSFAPNDFMFEAPGNLTSFVFKPLSPASATSFLFPQNGANNTTLSSFTDRVGRTSTPNPEKRSSRSQHKASTDKSASSEEETGPNLDSSAKKDATISKTETSTEATSNASLSTEASANGKSISGSPTLGSEDASSPVMEVQAGHKAEALEHEDEPKDKAEPSSTPPRQRSMRCEPAVPADEEIEGTTSARDPAHHDSDPQPRSESRRRSKRATSKVGPEIVKDEITPAKQRRSSRRSTASASKTAQEHSESLMEVIPEKTTSESTENEKTPANQRRASRKSTATGSEPAPEEDSKSQMEVVPESMSSEKTPGKHRRTSRRSTTTASKSSSEEDSESHMEVIPETMDKEKTPAKHRRTSRRSAASDSKPASQEDSESQMQVISEDTVPESVADKITPAKERRKSGRSRAVAYQEGSTPQAEAVPEKAGTEQVKTPRRSRRSCVTSLSTAEAQEDAPATEMVPDVEQADSLTPSARQSRKRSRRSVAKHPTEAATKDKNDLESTSEEERGKVTLADVIATEALLPTVSTTPKQNLRNGQTQDDLFVTPGMPVKRSTAKRRRTATMIALAHATSPEEAIKIIATSPMVEMNRRTPKSKAAPELRLNTTAALFDDDKSFSMPTLNLSSVFDSPTSSAASVSGAAPSSASSEAVADADPAPAAATSSEAHAEPAPSMTSTALEKPAESSDSSSGEEKRDVTPFRERLAAKIQKMTDMADHWTKLKKSTRGLSEEVVGQIDTTVCYAQLLMGRKGKFHQFSELVDKCEAGDPATTCQDLQGFQDMIFIQAEDISNKFAQLERLQQNQWQPEVENTTSRPQPAKKAVKKGAAAGGKKKPAGKSKFAAFRAQMMEQRKAAESGDQPAPEDKVFDAGFFRVSSPVRSPKYHCEAGTPNKCRSGQVSPRADSDSATSAASSSENTTSTATTPKMDNKENVAHILLRRSLGPTPVRRRSYVPVHPSPLLQDSAVPAGQTSPPSQAADAAAALNGSTRGAQEDPDTPKLNGSTRGAQEDPEELSDTPKRSKNRRSTRSRRSVCFAPEPAETVVAKETEEKDVEWASYFQPSTSQTTSPLKESAVDNSPFSVEDLWRRGKPDTPSLSSLPSEANTAQPQATGRRRKSSLKVLPSSERRRSRRSVNFALSPSKQQGASPVLPLPSTPYNRNSLVAGKRVSHHGVDGANHSVIDELQELSDLPPVRRSARPSLLYTPPKKDKKTPLTPAKEVPVATLISFTP